jgi:Fe-S-cluster-containing hydrogenase component 2
VLADNHTTDAHQRLARHLDETPLGAPQVPELAAILEALFSPEEAALAAELPFKPARVDRLAGELGREPAGLEALLRDMAGRGLLYLRETPGGPYFCLLPVVPGMMELQFMGGGAGPEKVRLARLFEDYYRPGTGRAMLAAGMPYSRVIPVERVVENRQEILPFERAAEVVRAAAAVAVANCYCRHEADLLGQGCGHPKDVCLMFGPFAEFAAARGWARLVETGEALATLERAEEAGLVHVTDNVASGANFMCNCCGCCCLFLRTITTLDQPGAVAQAAFLPEVDRAECTACGACAEACQVGAVRVEDEQPAAVDADRCLGCGQCLGACAFGAVEMVRRATAKPAASFPALAEAMAKGRRPVAPEAEGT